jgi:hypothetical protein
MLRNILRVFFFKSIVLIICFLIAGFYISFAQELTMYVLPAPKGIQWTSPHTVLSSYVKNMMTKNTAGKRHDMGHVIVELKNGNSYALIGMSPAGKYTLSWKVLFCGYGFGGFYYGFKGEMTNAAVNLPEIERRIKNGTVAYIKMKLSSAVFDRVWKYATEYEQYGYNKIYNGTNRPRYGEGAGCSAFGVSFLEVAGLPIEKMAADWIVSVPIQERFIGGPPGGGRYVNMLGLFFTNKWADSSNKNFRMASYYEPTVMYNWIVNAYNHNSCIKDCASEITGEAKGLVFDYSLALPPAGPIWLCDKEEPSLTNAARS